MAFPQPNADRYALNGSPFFRLNTLLSSPGDIYESGQGGLAFAIGPDSDIAKVNIGYYDDQVPTFLNTTTIGPDRPFIGLLSSRNDARYVPIDRPGKVLIWSADLYNPAYRPPGFNALIDLISYFTPRLDVIQYFTQQSSSIVSARNDKSYLIQNIFAPVIPTGDHFLMIPYWGRRFAQIQLTNKNKTGEPTTGAWSFAVSGVTFGISGSASVANNDTDFTQITTIIADAVVPAQTTVLKRITSFSDGVFDMLMLRIHRVNPDLDPPLGPIKITVSDVAQD